MSNNAINFVINVNGNSIPVMMELNDAVEKVKQNVDSATSNLKKLGDFASNIDFITNVVGKVTQAFQTMVGTSLDFEQQQANLKTLLNGDAEATENLVSQIREYGKATVYDRGGLVEAQKTMMAFGLDAEFAFGKLKNIGDIALGDSQKMQSLALAFSQATSSGKLMGQDLMQMINAGFNPLEVISQKTGKSMAELKDEMSKGGITADMLAQSLEWATEEGGRFYQGAETAAQTTAGKIAKMKDAIDDIKVSIFEATGGATAYVAEIGNMLLPLAQLSPLIMGAGKAFTFLKAKAISAYTTLGMYNGYLSIGKVQNLGFRKNVIQSAVALGRFATVGLFNALKALGAYLLSLITTGAASNTFAAIAGNAFRVFATTATTAISSIPIVGWIAIGITAIGGFTAWLYKKFASVRNWLDGVGSAILMLTGPLGAVINLVTSFVKHWQSIKTAFTDGGILAGIKRIGFVLIDAMLKPIQALLELLAKIPGMGKLAGKGSKWISDLRDSLDKSTYVESKKTKTDGSGAASTSVLSPEIQSLQQENKLSNGSMGSSAGTSAGKAQQINITLGSMVGTMNFNGGLQDNRRDVERQLTEIMARVLGMAETAI